jgi:phenylacetate-CoA ligase
MSKRSERLYSYLPFQFQNAAVSVFGYYWNRRRFGGFFSSELKKYKDREAFSSDQWISFQNQELQNILIHAFDKVQYYHEKFTDKGLKRSDLEHIKLMRLINCRYYIKMILEIWITSLMTKKKSKEVLFILQRQHGTPTKIFFSRETHQKWSAAFEARIRNWAGVTRFDSRGMIGGRRIIPDGASSGPYYRYNRIEKQIYFSAYHISSSTVADYADALLNYKPAYMTGYSMSNYFLARFLDEKSIKVPSLKAVITSSENLHPK